MQQECRSLSIMTSRRVTQTARHWPRWIAIGALALLGGCASLPEDQPVMEQLDSETGVTITRLGKPIEIFRETFLKQAPGRFGFIAPFETNLMGTRELYLWIAIPIEPAPNAEPTVSIDGNPVSLGKAGFDAEFAGLRKSPYRLATPWSAMFYFKIDAAIVERLGKSSQLVVEIFEATKEGAAKIEFVATISDERLRAFASR
jgi:hypothetical protein